MSHRLTIKGQVTIPKEIREVLGLEAGNSCVEFTLNADGTVTVKKAEATKPKKVDTHHVNPFAQSLPYTVRRVPAHASHTTNAAHARSRAHGGVLALLAGGL